MQKRSYFDVFHGPGWPTPEQLKPYFLGAPGHPSSFDSDNDSWSLRAEGMDGTELLPEGKGRTDLYLFMTGHPKYGVLLNYRKYGGGRQEEYFSKGDLSRLRQWIRSAHGDLLAIGLFIPIDRAWRAVKEFIETDGTLPRTIEWLSSAELPEDTFPPQWADVPVEDDPYAARAARMREQET
ncbi:MAG: hypothetical protein IT537_13135 [Hyphomicrobiales bacterium]|nr:hypothetical protein [Hyphomicrobiales bacterium]